VANGKVYLATFSNRLNVYGLLPLPSLSTRLSGTNILISWPTNAFLTYSLQGNTNLLSANWVNVTNNVVLTSGMSQVTVLATGKATFYRLKR
jgi:hypothetical protein